MGTPDFAVEALRQLVEGGYNVVGVITMPDKPAGRGHKIQYSPVKQYALEQNLPLLQPEKLKDEAFVQALRDWKADLQIVVAFRMLPEVVWNMPRWVLSTCTLRCFLSIGVLLLSIGRLSTVIRRQVLLPSSCNTRLIPEK